MTTRGDAYISTPMMTHMDPTITPRWCFFVISNRQATMTP